MGFGKVETIFGATVPATTTLPYTAQAKPKAARDVYAQAAPSMIFGQPYRSGVAGRDPKTISIAVPGFKNIPVEINGPIHSIDEQIKQVIGKIAPSVVFVRGMGNGTDQWSGSGTIVDPADLFPGQTFPPGTYAVITNNHVAPNGETKALSVTTATGQEYVAAVLKALDGKHTVQDKTVDIAILLIHSDTPLKTARIAKTPAEQGDTVLALGHSLGLPRLVVTKGMVSQPAQLTGDSLIAIQADASINPGNSGGPLVRIGEDGEPEIIGTNTYTFRDAEDMTFAIPIQRQLEVAKTILETGEFLRGSVGCDVAEFPLLERMMTGFPTGITGAKITWVDRGNPLDKGGLKNGDIITSMEASDGTSIKLNIWNKYQVTEFYEWVHARKPGVTITVHAYAKTTGPGGKVEWKQKDIVIGAEKMKERTQLASSEWGITLDKDPAGRLIISKVDAGSPAATAGIPGGKWVLLGLGAKALSEDPISVSDLDLMKEIFIALRDSEAKDIELYLQDAKNPKQRTVVKLTAKEVMSTLSEAFYSRMMEEAAAAYIG